MNIAKGKWKSVANPYSEKYEIFASDGADIAVCGGPYLKDHARLIIEAGTVYNEVGLTPRELVEQRQELLDACKKARKWFEDFIECKPRPNEQPAINMQSELHEAIVSAYAITKAGG